MDFVNGKGKANESKSDSMNFLPCSYVNIFIVNTPGWNINGNIPCWNQENFE